VHHREHGEQLDHLGIVLPLRGRQSQTAVSTHPAQTRFAHAPPQQSYWHEVGGGPLQSVFSQALSPSHSTVHEPGPQSTPMFRQALAPSHSTLQATLVLQSTPPWHALLPRQCTSHGPLPHVTTLFTQASRPWHVTVHGPFDGHSTVPSLQAPSTVQLITHASAAVQSTPIEHGVGPPMQLIVQVRPAGHVGRRESATPITQCPVVASQVPPAAAQVPASQRGRIAPSPPPPVSSLDTSPGRPSPGSGAASNPTRPQPMAPSIQNARICRRGLIASMMALRAPRRQDVWLCYRFAVGVRDLIDQLGKDLEGYATTRTFPRELPLAEAAEVAVFVHERVEQAIDDRTKAIAGAGKIIACARGCNGCCEEPIMVFRPEAARVALWLAKPENAPVRAQFLAAYPGWEAAIGETVTKLSEIYETDQMSFVARHVDAWRERVVCPFNVNGDCTVYPVRPSVCRTGHALGTNKNCSGAAEGKALRFDFVPLDNFVERTRILLLATNNAMAGKRGRPEALPIAVRGLLDQ